MLIQTSKLKQINRQTIIIFYFIKIMQNCFIRMPVPKLPTWQDCHELWSKKRRRQIREQQESLQNLPPGKPLKSDLNDQ